MYYLLVESKKRKAVLNALLKVLLCPGGPSAPWNELTDKIHAPLTLVNTSWSSPIEGFSPHMGTGQYCFIISIMSIQDVEI